MLYESEVIDAVCRFLEEHKLQVVQRKRGRERGDDILAQGARGRFALHVEAKGEGSEDSGSKRFGCEFNSNQSPITRRRRFIVLQRCSKRPTARRSVLSESLSRIILLSERRSVRSTSLLGSWGF